MLRPETFRFKISGSSQGCLHCGLFVLQKQLTFCITKSKMIVI
nr:MAG TPA: hypothetical protein [Caudoviricetes sp.]